MSKRFIFPQQHGERKKAKLDISISDHNFPLSQNKDAADNWGDDNDDEILLLASQACEEAFTNNDVSSLPDYSMCMQPTTTSTQMFDLPSTSKSPFTFKKPVSHPSTAITTNLKDKCNRISSPLPGMLSKVSSNTNNQLFDDFNDKIYKDSDQIYRQLLQLQEENAKLKSENGILQEKAVTKEGEASILRTQLKSCQVALDNARMERVRAQEKTQMEWTEKVTAANGQIHDLRNQLDFKNLEIISVKERCRMLESNKVKLTQVAVNDNNNRMDNSFQNDQSFTQRRKVKLCNNIAQTNTKVHFLELSKTTHPEPSKLYKILPLILQAVPNQQLSLISYNDKLQRHTDYSLNKCRVYNTFYRMPSSTVGSREREEDSKIVDLSSLYENISCIAAGSNVSEEYFQLFTTAKHILSQTVSELEVISSRSSTAFQKEMDEKYIHSTLSLIVMYKEDLLSSRAIFKEEQAILSRRIIAILYYVIDSRNIMRLYENYERTEGQHNTQNLGSITEIIIRICKLCDSTSCALLYSGLLLSILYFLSRLIKYNQNITNIQTLDILKYIISSRPMSIVNCKLLKLLRKMSLDEKFLTSLCPASNVGNLKIDYEQGVLLYKKDSCYLQVFLKQIEAALKCIEKQQLVKLAETITIHLMALCSNINGDCGTLMQDKTKCDCRVVLMQVIVYSLKICASMLELCKDHESDLMRVCRSGIVLLYQSLLAESPGLGYHEGWLTNFCELMNARTHNELYSNMLSELSSTFSSSPSDEAKPPHDAWISSFDTFTIAD